MQSRQAVFTRKDMNNMTIAEVKAAVDREMRRGVYIEAVTRMGRPLPVLPGMTTSIEIRTGERSVLEFLISPMLKGREAFRER